MKIQKLTAALALSLAFTGFCALSADANRRIVFGAVDQITAPVILKSKSTDYMQMFEPDAPWQKASSHLDAFQISMQFAQSAKDEEVVKLISFLQTKRIALGLSMGMLRADRGCGRGEGYMPKQTLHGAMRRLKRLGAQLDYVEMDEVVYFGRWNNHPSSGLPPCHDDVEEIVREVAESVSEIHQYYPNAKIGFVEPIGGQLDRLGHPTNPNQNVLIADYLKFVDLYEAATKSKLAFYHADVAWRSKGWQPVLARLKAKIVAKQIPFGIIIGGTPDFSDDISWTRAGLQTMRALLADPALAPEDIVIGSWQPFPTHCLPEDEPGSSTWMLLQAIRTEKALERNKGAGEN